MAGHICYDLSLSANGCQSIQTIIIAIRQIILLSVDHVGWRARLAVDGCNKHAWK
jgi:hypothetical protein